MLNRTDARRGFTLVELMVAMVLLAIVSVPIYQTLTNSQRLARVQAERVSLQASVRSGLLVVPAELREVNVVTGSSTQTDLQSILANAVTYRASRGLGFVCQVDAAGTEFRVRTADYSGYRQPAAPDDAYLFVENDPDLETDDTWRLVRLQSVAAGTCAGSAPALVIKTSGTFLATGITTASPVRFYDTIELKSYQADGRWWLGMRSVNRGEALQPVLGPLPSDTAFKLTYLNASGSTTTDAKLVRRIRLQIRGATERMVNGYPAAGQRNYILDSVATDVAIRNVTP